MLTGRSGRTSTLPGLKTPVHRNAVNKSTVQWLKDRGDDDGAEGLWRIHDNLYDFSSFVENHPGGQEWLQLTKGTDITEAFEAHHISPVPSKMINRYFIRAAKTKRNSPYTFDSKGFYATLRRKVFDLMVENSSYGPSLRSCLIADITVVCLLILAMSSASRQSQVLAVFAGLFLGFITSISHNFFHLKENFRRYYFDLGGLSSTSWRISHALSHHLYPNTITDIEISMSEPFFYWLPFKDKNLVERYFTWITSPLIYALVFPIEFIRRIVLFGVCKTDIIPLMLPILMLMRAPTGHVADTLLLWLCIMMCGSFYTISTSINGAHHHPSIYHDGDAHREDRDWGLAQIDAVRDRPFISGVEGNWSYDKDGHPLVIIDNTQSHSFWTLMKVLTNFGHHALHHLFPTIDHANLPQLYPALAETLTEFRLPFITMSVTDLAKGQFLQLAKNVPNTSPPIYLTDKME